MNEYVVTLRSLLEDLHGKPLDFPVKVSWNNKTYYPTEINYSTKNKFISLICDVNKENKTTLRRILEILHFHDLNQDIKIKIDDKYLDITNLVTSTNDISLVVNE